MPQVKQYNTLKKLLPGDDVLSQCMHCGMCLAVCPTYNITGRERSSPRGRIRLIKAVAGGELELTSTFAFEMDYCLDCQACESACPAGVHYGSMVESARNVLADSGKESVLKRAVKKILFRSMLHYPARIKKAAKLLKAYQKSGLRKFIHSSVIIKKYFGRLLEIDNLAPQVSDYFSDDVIPERIAAESKPAFKIAILTGCLMDVMFADINIDTVDALKMLGCEVIKPGGQVCCGSMPGHNGDIESAKELARKNIDAFEKYDYDFLVSNSSGCGAYLKEYGALLKDDKMYARRASVFSGKVKDIMEFIYEKFPGFTFNCLNDSVTYHDACHLIHTQKIFSEPRKVIKAIPGLRYSELEEAGWCCGSAGIYNIIHYYDSMKILERKMNNIKNSRAETVLAGNHGCIAQLKYGAEKFNMDVKVIHPVTLIKKALSD